MVMRGEVACLPRRVLVALLVLLCCMEAAVAAGLSVTVKARGSGEVVEGATVVLDGGVAYDETDHAGEVAFADIPPPAEVKVLAPGFETLVTPLTPGRLVVTLYLTPLILEGETLEVTAARLVERASKLTLSSAELVRSAGSGGDPLKAITALPGVVEANEGSAEVYMRGSNGNENITWVNNAPVGYLYHFGGLQSTINPALIEDINVFLGGFPVQYGDALGGVVDAKLRTPKSDRMHYQFDISTINSSFLVEGPAGEAGGDSFFVAGRRSYLDLIFSPADATEAFSDDDEEDPDQILLVPRFYDFQALYRHQLDGGYLDSYVFAAADEMGMELRSSARSDPQLAGEVHQKIEYQTTGLTWQQRWNSHWEGIATLAYIHEKSATRLGRDEQGGSFYAHVEESTLYLQPELRWQPLAGSQFSLGLDSAYARIPVSVYAPRSGTENDPDYDFTSQRKYRLERDLRARGVSPFLRYRQRWGERLTTELGLRHTNIELSGGFHAHELSPRATLEYQLTPETLLTASWGRYIQMPAGEEVVESFGNPALLMTEAEHRILGIEHQITPLYSVKAEIYHKPMENLVIALDENEPPDNFANRGTGEAYGFDLFIKRKPGQRRIGWLSLSWARSRRTNEITGITRDFSGDQPLTLTAVWGQPFGGSWRRWEWSVKGQVRSGRPYTAVVGRYWDAANNRWLAEYGDHNGERLPTYYKVDLRIGREVLLKESTLTLYLDLQNVTFAHNVVEYDYGSEYEKIDNPTEITGMSFFPFFGVEMEF